MVLREANDPLNQSRGIMGPLENSAVANNRGRLRQRFDLIRKLGQGTYGKVQLGIDKETGQEVAIKTIKKSKIETEADLIRIRREIQIMSSVRHPNIIHIYEVFENREKMVLVMEYAAGGELYDYLNERKVLQEDEARRIFRQIASAVYYCHKHKICHRDLKLENILLDENTNAKIADFGLSNVFDDVNLLKTFCGSPLYASPEIVRGTPYYGPEVDCWSLGVLLYTLVYGAMPFDGSNFKRLVKQISNGDYYEPKKPAEASRLIKCMLTVDPVKRASIKDVCAHQWINQGFDKHCLTTAEELANQTPVRLDLLLSVAPQHNINHNHVVIAESGQSVADDTTTSELPGASSKSPKKISDKGKDKRGEPSDVAKPTAAVAPFEKPARSSIHKEPKPAEGATAKPAVKDVKHKPAVKKKSKSSPILELIVDVEEERERLEDIMDVEGPDDDDAADTLSEISEIQTMAEDTKEATPSKPAKTPAKTKEAKEEPKVVEVKGKESVVEPAAKKAKETPAADSAPKSPKPSKAVQPQKADVPQPLPMPTEEVNLKPEKPKEEKAEPKPEVKVKLKPKAKPEAVSQESAAKEVKVAQEPAVEPKQPDAEPKKVEEVTEAKPTTVKKKVVKKVADKDKQAIAGDEADKSKPPSGSGTASATGSSSSLASSAGKSGTKLDKEGKVTKLRNRSDSNSSADASPTRIERRSSKIISQKTAELIQNLETKTSTGSSDKPKKLVFPSLKVSDAKKAFEKPPKPVKEPVSSSPPKSKTEEPKKAKEDKLAVAKPKKSKSKSPSPAPEKEKTGETKTSPATEVVEPKEEKPMTDKLPEPSATGQKRSPSPKPKAELAPKPASPKSRSPEPPSEVSTVVDATKSEADTTLSGVSTTTATTAPKAPAPKVLKLKIQKPGPEDQQLKPVIVDCGKGAPKQGLMLIAGKTTPPVRSTPTPVDVDCSISPFFSDAEPKTAPVEAKRPEPDRKEQAVKKISSVISRIASSESAERIMREGQEKPKKGPKTIKSEMEKFVPVPGTPQQKQPVMQRTEVSFPVAAAQSPTPTERIIPIKFEEGVNPSTPPVATQQHSHPLDTQSAKAQSAPNISRTIPKRMESTTPSTSTVFSRQNSSDTESSAAPPLHRLEPIKKSPREFIIPIKLETSGQTVTPKDDVSETSLSEDPFRMDSRLRSGRFGRHKRYSSLLSDSSLEEEPATGTVTASTSRRSSTTLPCHTRSHSQGDEPDNPTTPLTMKHRRSRRSGGTPLDRSDSFSSAEEEDDEDNFEVLTAESLFSNLLDRVRNLTKRINREDGTNWPMPETSGFGMFAGNPLRDFMSRAPSEARSFVSTVPASGSYSMSRSYSREPSVTVTISTGPGWRRSLSREMSGDSDSASAFSEPQSASYSASGTNANRGYGLHSTKSSMSSVTDKSFEPSTVRPYQSMTTGRRIPYSSQKSEPYDPLASDRSSHLTSSYNPPTARPYTRSISNNEFSTSVTLPFRRSLKSYEKPSYDYTSPSSTTTSGLGYSWDSGQGSGLSSSGVGYGGGPPHRSNSVMARYASGMGGSSTTSTSESGISSPYATLGPRYTRSLSRAKATPEPDPGKFRDYSIQRNGEGTTSSISSLGSSNIPSASARLPGESNGWVGGSSSSSVKTATAASTESMLSTHEKMKNYTNYYQNHGMNPASSRQLSPGNVEEIPGVNGRRSPLSPSRVMPVELGGPQSSFARASPSRFDDRKSALGVGHVKSTPILNSLRNRRAASVSKTMSFLPQSREGTPAPPEDPGLASTTSQSAGPTSGIPKWPTITPKVYRPVTVSPINDMGSPSPPTVGIPQQVIRQAEATPTPPAPPTSKLPMAQAAGSAQTLPSRGSRATSVEKITRLLERKSVPRDRVISPPPTRQNMASPPPPEPIADVEQPQHNGSSLPNGDGPKDPNLKRNESPEKSKPSSKLNKPKFIQSLEKKWEKLKSPAPSPVSQLEDNPESDSLGSGTKLDSESTFLQRAVSPEKKPKSKFGASTVNFMLGKFRKFEENSSPSNPTGKPPASGVSRIGRRVQSAYAGACSDSVLTLPQTMLQTDDDQGSSNDQRRSPLKSLTKSKPDCSAASTSEEFKSSKRPVSLGSYNTSAPEPGSATGPSTGIPRYQRTLTSPLINGNGVSESTADTKSYAAENPPSLQPPTINIKTAQSYSSENNDDNPLTPNSVSDSFDSGSVCSEKLEGRSVLDDEESVSDRIFRKSFYPRFNSLERKRSSSVTSTGPRLFVQQKSKSSSGRSSLSPANSRVRQPSLDPDDSLCESYDPMCSSQHAPGGKDPSPHKLTPLDEETDLVASMKINKYNPNPLFKELITDDFKSDVGRKAEYSRRVTSKLSKLLREIESDIGGSGGASKSKDSQTNSNIPNGKVNGTGISRIQSSPASTPNWKPREKQSPNCRIQSRAVNSGEAPLVRDEIDDLCNCIQETCDL